MPSADMPPTDQRNQMNAHTYTIGNARVTRVTDTLLTGITPAYLYADWRDAALDEQPQLRELFDASGEHIILSVHTWVVELGGKVYLIDTGLGNDKERPFNALFHRLRTPFLQRLAALGIQPEDVDHVLLTHLHADHVGWNTRLAEGRWVPTFPNACYAMPQGELDFFATPEADKRRVVFDDSVAPVLASGQAVGIAAAGADYADAFHFHPTPGHCAGHMSITLHSAGATAIFSGDAMHSPAQVYHPEWNSAFCREQDGARTSRRWLLDYACEHQATVFTAHFGASSAGRVGRSANGYGWQFL
ncbi:MBL fold metallo-hydrolase [Chromobacterium subtsugae]|uniref:MBL fold metallo-hydrolase n=1 Tax=Chromobacterium subtsugae TaxID=251747 RepID=UPI000A587FFB|nr:MBL fold metallo-hydrolase [Chromobacterium subtsugae]